ncbi:MAG: site-2 protease family protein [Candidatus Pacebacteria bacterium]|nr:site-2 protease family protein [Candidatus Paceibacterota bacterium]
MFSFSGILIAFISLVGLIVLHELGHFVLAKKFKVKVEEFGLGYPPKIWGIKFKDTLYSLNLLPFGAFVKLYGEDKKIDDPQSFSAKPFWQKSLIILGGVISFWVISFILLSIVMGLGVPSVIDDNENILNPMVEIIEVSSNSPAEKAGIKAGDIILNLKYKESSFKIEKVKDFQDLIEKYKGEEIILTIKRGNEIKDVFLTPRVSPPSGEGALGVGLIRVGIKSYPFYKAPIEGLKATVNLTIMAVKGWIDAIVNWVTGKPVQAQLMGPVGVFDLFNQASKMGLSYFLQFVAIISIFLALANILPIPATDGGRFLFLLIEKIRKKPISEKVEQNAILISFVLLLILMVYVTIKDIIRIF